MMDYKSQEDYETEIQKNEENKTITYRTKNKHVNKPEHAGITIRCP